MSAQPTPAPGPVAPPPAAAVRGDLESWNWLDRLAVAASWVAGIGLCAIAFAIVIYMFVKGLEYVSIDLIFSKPLPGLDQSQTGGFLDPLIGTVIVAIIGTVIAAPIGIATAIWLSEYGKPAGLARAVESGVEIVAGTPSIVLAIFGLLLFTQGIFSFLSFTAEGAGVFGRSFLIAGIMMSLIALPLVVGGTREALQAIPSHVREASYALGKDRITTIRRVLLPSSRAGIATGITLGMGRIIGDTAIIVDPPRAPPSRSSRPRIRNIPVLDTLRGTGGTLTSYVYNNSPAGEGGAPEKAYAAAFVLLVIVIVLNLVVGRSLAGGARR